MPNISRRFALTTLPALGAAAIIPSCPRTTPAPAWGEAHAATHDPLLETINAYRNGFEEYGASGDESPEFAYQTMGQHLRRLKAWDQPATTPAGAVAALSLVLEDAETCEWDELHENMVRAALGFINSLAAPETS